MSLVVSDKNNIRSTAAGADYNAPWDERVTQQLALLGRLGRSQIETRDNSTRFDMSN